MNVYVSAALTIEQQILVACDKNVINKDNRFSNNTLTAKLIAIIGQHTSLPIKSTVDSGHKANLIKYGQIRTHCQEKVGYIREQSQHNVYMSQQYTQLIKL